MKITIGGNPGSGKTSLGKALAKKFKLKFYSMGDLRGKLALKHNLTIDQLNEIGKKEFWTDKYVDDFLKKLNKKDNFIVDGWLAFYFIKDSIKIFLKADSNKAAERIFRNQRKDEEHKDTVKEIKAMIKKRIKETDARYKKYYNVNYQDEKNYDFILNTTNLTVEKSLKKILEFLKRKNKKRKIKSIC